MPEFNPVLVKELRGRMRGARAFVVLTIYLLILGGVALLFYAAMVSSYSSNLDRSREIGKALFMLLAAVALIEVCIITPTLTTGSIAGEKERQTYDLLVASLLSPWQIVWGKLASALSFALLLILSVVPMMSLAFLFGGVSLAEVLIALVGLITTAVFYAVIGLFWSTMLRSTLMANSLALGTIILMLLGIPFLLMIFSIFGFTSSSSWMNTVPFIYIGGTILCSHPFIALGITESQLSSGENPFYFHMTVGYPSSYHIYVPSPWIVYVLVALLLSLVLLLFSVRKLHPEQNGPIKQKQEIKSS